jgi:hypothetical protein
MKPRRTGEKTMTRNPMVNIPENNLGIPTGPQDVVALLRQFADSPAAIRFIADMMEV